MQNSGLRSPVLLQLHDPRGCTQAMLATGMLTNIANQAREPAAVLQHHEKV
jgi:hypothetical protein